MKLSKHRTGLTLAVFFGIAHLAWLILVGLNLGQSVLDFIHSAHHLTNPYVVSPLELPEAGILLIYAVIAGYVFGWLFACVWNKFNKNK